MKSAEKLDHDTIFPYLTDGGELKSLTNKVSGPTFQVFLDENGADHNNFTKQQYSLMSAISERDRTL